MQPDTVDCLRSFSLQLYHNFKYFYVHLLLIFAKNNFLQCFLYLAIAVGHKPNRSSGKKDLSILKLSVEVPYTLNADVIICSKKCMKNPKKPFEFTLKSGFSEIAGKITVGFGQKSYEKAMSYKLSPGGVTPLRFVRGYLCS